MDGFSCEFREAITSMESLEFQSGSQFLSTAINPLKQVCFDISLRLLSYQMTFSHLKKMRIQKRVKQASSSCKSISLCIMGNLVALVWGMVGDRAPHLVAKTVSTVRT